MSAFAEPLARARATLNKAAFGSARTTDYTQALAALDLIEQRAAEMEAERNDWAKAAARFAGYADRAEARAEELERALDARWRELLDHASEADDDGAHIGFARHYRAKAEGIAEALKIVRAALSAREEAQA